MIAQFKPVAALGWLNNGVDEGGGGGWTIRGCSGDASISHAVQLLYRPRLGAFSPGPRTLTVIPSARSMPT